MIWNIQKGDKPIPHAAIDRAAEPEMKRRGWPSRLREEMMLAISADPTSPAAQAALGDLAEFKADFANVKAINAFNHERAAYRKALARLDRVELSAGREAYEEPTGEIDEDGNPVTVTIPAIEPLKGGTVEVPVYDDAGNQTGTETQPDEAQKLIDADKAERAAAQAVIDETKPEVADFDV